MSHRIEHRPLSAQERSGQDLRWWEGRVAPALLAVGWFVVGGVLSFLVAMLVIGPFGVSGAFDELSDFSRSLLLALIWGSVLAGGLYAALRNYLRLSAPTRRLRADLRRGEVEVIELGDARIAVVFELAGFDEFLFDAGGGKTLYLAEALDPALFGPASNPDATREFDNDGELPFPCRDFRVHVLPRSGVALRIEALSERVEPDLQAIWRDAPAALQGRVAATFRRQAVLLDLDFAALPMVADTPSQD